MRSEYQMLLEQRALMEAQLLEARDAAIKARFIPQFVKWYAHSMDNQREGNRDRLINRNIEFIKPKVNSNLFYRVKPDATDIEKSWDRDKVFEYDLYFAALAEKTIEFIMEADPDRTKSFSTWMCSVFLKDQMLLEDLPRFTDTLEFFGELVRRKKLPVEQRDINRYPDIQSVMDAIKPFKQEAVAAQNAAYEAEMLSQSFVYEDNDHYIFLSPRTEQAAQWFGRDTEWCTAWGSKFGRYPTRNGLYNHYAKESPLFILRDKQNDGNRFQLHFTSGQYMDINDRRIDLNKLVAAYPGLNEAMLRAASREGEGEMQIGPFAATTTETPQGFYVDLRPNVFSSASSGIQALSLVFTRKGIISLRGEKARGGRHRLLSITPHNSTADIRDHLITALNTYGFHGDCSASVNAGIAYSLSAKKYHYAEKAPSLSMSRKTQWRKFTMEDDGLRYVLFDKDKSVVTVDVVPVETNRSVIRLPEFTKGYEKELLSILKAMSNRSRVALAQDHTIIGNLSSDDAKTILKMRPDWGTTADRFLAFGDTPALRRRVISELEEYTSTAATIMDNRIVLDRWKDYTACFDEIGTDYAENILKYIDGRRHLDYYGDYDIDDYMKRELLEGLQKETLMSLFEWIKKEYEGEEEMEQIDLSDPISAILAIDEEFGCDELRSAYRQARASGDESGALGEMAKSLTNSIEREDNIWFVDGKRLVKEFSWDAEVVLAVSMSDLLSRYRNPEQLIDLSYDGWPQVFTEHGKVGPQYDDDYSDYSEDAAKDSFEDAVSEFLP